MNPTVLASLALALLALASLVVSLASRRALDHERADHASSMEALRDEIWQLKAAASARDRAEAASEAKSRFLATVSHEIRTPLSGIIGLADLLSDGMLDGEQRAYVDSIRTSGAALASLIDEILDFSKIEAGKIELAHEPIGLAAMIEGIAELLAPRAHGKGLEIATFVDPAAPRLLLGDEARLRQVLMNLAGNAVKFTDAGGVGVRVTLEDAQTLSVEVFDTGPGVPEHRRTAIFDEFEQGDTSMHGQHGGTGLGLAISKRLVDRMGGAITLRARPGGGSVFAFAVPFGHVAPDPLRDDMPAACDEGSDLVATTVLIVATSVFEAPYLGALLQARGASVCFVPDPAQARARLQAGLNAHVMLVDCALGAAAIAAAAALTRDFSIGRSLILFSPYERREFGQSSVEGFSGWLVKPVRAASLFIRLADALPHKVSVRRQTIGGPARPRPALRVLLAEDDEINALIARAFLARLGADAVHVTDGAAALALARDAIEGGVAPFDVAVLDIRMPLLDGREVAKGIRLAERAAGSAPMRLVALTANAFEEDRRACLEAGFDAVLMKPVDAVAFGNALEASAAPAPARTVASNVNDIRQGAADPFRA